MMSPIAQELMREVLIHGPLSRTQLATRLGLSQASLTRLSRPFIDQGIFVDSAQGGSAQTGSVQTDSAQGRDHVTERVLGRPPKPLDVRVDAQQFVGIKLTADALFAVRTDLRAGERESLTRSLGSHDPSDVVSVIVEVVRTLSAEHPVTAVGISLGGQVAGSRFVTRAPFLQWRDVDLGGLLSAVLDVAVTVENDVVALTAAEHWFGSAKGLSDFAVITVGAGVGYGLVIHDRPVTSSNTGLGLGGHLALDRSGPLCFEGHRGCSTAMLSIASMCASAGVGLGRVVDYDELLGLARDGQPVALEVVSAAAAALGFMVATVSNIAMVDTVVLSGEGVRLVTLFEASVQASISENRDPESTPVTLLVDDSGFDVWARGAAAIAIQASFGLLLS